MAHILAVFSLSLLLLGLLALPNPSLSVANAVTTFFVNTTADDDDGSCDPLPSGDCTLREAIDAAEAHTGIDTIAFDIPATDPNYGRNTPGVWTIDIASTLALTGYHGEIVDGTTQAANYGSDTNPYGPEIEITGETLLPAVRCWGLVGTGAHTIKGLVIRCPGTGLLIDGANNTIIGNYIGTDATGTAAPLGSLGAGIFLRWDADNNTIGGSTEADRNLISGHHSGILLYGSTTTGNVIEGNYIGTDRTGTQPLGNTYYGIGISEGAHDNTIGPNNIIAYNGSSGVLVSGATTTGNTITQNSIHSNALMGITLSGGGNNALASPSLSPGTCSSVSGSTPIAYPNVAVEVFSDGDGQGRSYEEGTFAWPMNVYIFTFYPDSGWLRGPMVTATITDLTTGDTSEFSAPVSSGCPLIFLPLIMKNY